LYAQWGTGGASGQNLCNGASSPNVCTFGELTYNQWENGKVMQNLPSWIPGTQDLTIDASY